ncbi:MAG: LysE family translocator [Verrucomicrobiota bacterium]
MFGIHDFGVFLVAGILLNLTPGPDTFYILGRSLAQGRSAGIASALGIGAGTLVHTFAAALGLSAIIATSATAFLAVKLAAAAYLIYLGARLLLTRASATAIPATFTTSGFRAVFRQGLLTNVLNPKVALFFLAFMPQFIAADSPSKFAAFITLGLCFVVTGTLWCLCLAWFAALLGNRLRGNPSFSTALNRMAGALFVVLGLRLAAAK